jgi:hypothetical protein
VDSFVRAARKCSNEIRSFCLMLAYSGCRISEALSLRPDNIDFETGHVIIQCLKKRGKRVFRAIPLPPQYLTALRRLCKAHGRGAAPLWPWSRMTGYRRICEVMQDAGIRGSYASPKGLRHAFGVRAIQASVPLNLVQKWLGHADIKTTAIYTNAIGPEEQEIAARMWRSRSAWTSPPGEQREAHLDRRGMNFGDSTEPEWDGATADSGSQCAETHEIADSGEKHPVCAPIANFPPPGKIPFESRIKRMIYCSLLQYWIDRRRIAGLVRRASGVLDGASGGETRGEEWRQRALAAPSPAAA